MNIKTFLTSPLTIATTLLAIIIDKWGTEALYWDAEVLEEELEKFGQIPRINLDKIHGLTTALTTDSFYTDVWTFSLLCNTLGGMDDRIVFGVFEPPAPEEVAWTVYEVCYVNDPQDIEIKDRFHPDIIQFIKIILEQGGLLAAPKVLNFIELKDTDPDVFEEDPEIYESYYKFLQENQKSVDSYVNNRVTQMLNELSNVPFEEGDFEELNKRLD